MHTLVLTSLGFITASLAAWSACAAPEAPAAAASASVRVEYRKPASPAHEAIFTDLRDRRTLEQVQEVLSVLRLPRTLTLALAGCEGTANAWYEPENTTVTFCYEYLDEMRRKAAARPLGKVSQQEARDGPALFVLLHESGHAVFDLLKVPILGREEDAADTFAAVVLLRLGQAVAMRTLRGAAWAYHNEAGARAPDEGDFADIHSLDSQRFYNIVCLAYGSDPKYFAAAVTDKLLPQDRAEGCADEYHQALFAFQKLILPSVAPRELERLRTRHHRDWQPGR